MVDFLVENGLFLATGESYTGSMIDTACTDLARSRAWFERCFVTYSNTAKTELLGVDAALVDQYSASVSKSSAQWLSVLSATMQRNAKSGVLAKSVNNSS